MHHRHPKRGISITLPFPPDSRWRCCGTQKKGDTTQEVMQHINHRDRAMLAATNPLVVERTSAIPFRARPRPREARPEVEICPLKHAKGRTAAPASPSEPGPNTRKIYRIGSQGTTTLHRPVLDATGRLYLLHRHDGDRDAVRRARSSVRVSCDSTVMDDAVGSLLDSSCLAGHEDLHLSRDEPSRGSRCVMRSLTGKTRRHALGRMPPRSV